METIYTKIGEAIKNSGIKGIKYVEDYPMDFVKLEDELIEDEESDTLTPLVKAMEVITKTIKDCGDSNEDIRVCFTHLPGEEEWGISIGDGR